MLSGRLWWRCDSSATIWGVAHLRWSAVIPRVLIEDVRGGDRFLRVTLPLLKPVLVITTMFSVIWTFSDFQLVYVLTGGGPSNQTHLFATYAFNVAMGAGQLGSGASIALSMLPPLLMVIAALSLYLRRA